MGNYSLDDIGDIFEKGFPEKDLFYCRKRHYRPFFDNKSKRAQNKKKFGLNESLLKFFNLPGYNANSANGKKDYFADKL